MGIYAALGVSQALSAFVNGVVFALLIYSASRQLHRAAIYRVLHAPMTFFETTPVGRIMNRFSKDVDTMDNMLAGEFCRGDRFLIETDLGERRVPDDAQHVIEHYWCNHPHFNPAAVVPHCCRCGDRALCHGGSVLSGQRA
jgi:ABC-type multidrug transport system fused ATPase/permease subunit